MRVKYISKLAAHLRGTARKSLGEMLTGGGKRKSPVSQLSCLDCAENLPKSGYCAGKPRRGKLSKTENSVADFIRYCRLSVAHFYIHFYLNSLTSWTFSTVCIKI
jgi:hypothetical protein